MPHSLFLPAEEPLPAALSVQSSAASGRHGVKANHIKKEALKNQGFFAAPDRIRTCGLSVRSRTLSSLSYGGVRLCFSPFSILHGIVENVNSFPPVSFRQKPASF